MNTASIAVMAAPKGPVGRLAIRLARLTALLALVPLLYSAPSLAQGLPGMGGDASVEVNADQAIEWHQAQRAYVARGNASAKRGESTIFADVLTAYYREVPGRGNEVFQLVADGNVRIIGPAREVRGARGVYDVDRQLAVVTGGDLRLVTAREVVTARDSLEYYEDRQLAVARGNAVAVRGTDRLAADVLIGQFAKAADGSTSMQRLDGRGDVVVTTATDVALADTLVYGVADEVAVLMGGVKITRGDNQLNGDAAEMNMKTRVNRVIAGTSGGRVSGLLIPGQSPPSKSPSPKSPAP